MSESHPAVDLLESLVSIPSPSGRESEASAWLVDWMAARGLAAHVDAVGNAVGTRGQGPRQVMLLGHIDTFPGELPVRREEGWLYGRGTVDAKGPLCAFTAAAAEVDPPPGWRVTVVGAVEEEAATSRGARHLVNCQPIPDICIIGEPSGWDRVTTGYKGRLLVDVRMRAPFAHSAGQARLPAEQAVDLWNAVVTHCDEFNAGRQKTFDQLDPSLRHIITQDEGAYGTAQMSLGFRLPPDLSPGALAEDLQRLSQKMSTLADRQIGKSTTQQINKSTNQQDSKLAKPSTDFRLTSSGAETAFRAEKNTPLVRAFLAAIREGGGRPRFVLKTGTSDMNVVGPVWGCPICSYGPGDSALDHTPGERIRLSEYLQSIGILKAVLHILMDGTQNRSSR